MSDCQCLEATQGLCAEGSGTDVGTDTPKGRYGDVSLHTCPDCQRIWLFYRVEYEGFSASGRWYRGLITPAIAVTVTAETAAQGIADSEYQVIGGSYYSTSGHIHVGPGEIKVDLFGEYIKPTSGAAPS